MARVTLNLPEELIAELEKRAEKSGKSIPDFVREELELRYLRRLRNVGGKISPSARTSRELYAYKTRCGKG